jgi:hypothetical protein
MRTAAGLVVVWVVAWLLTLTTYTFTDDHFDRISRARQIARYGELPFRDFFDPGYFLTEFASAAAQRLTGGTLLGEVLFTSAFIAAGAVIVFALVRRVAPSGVSAALIAALVMLSSPRPYDFDKFFFYPLGILLCWQYIERRTWSSLFCLSGTAVAAGMFRYDNGAFIAAGALVAIVVVHAREAPSLLRRAGVFAAACIVWAIPYLVFLQITAGIGDAAGQMIDYARREGARTRIAEVPADVFSDFRVEPVRPSPPDRIQIRWAPSADTERQQLESRYRLHDGVTRGDPADRTWVYEIDDASRENLRALIDDPRVADTHLVDRAAAQLTPQESLTRRLHRKIPLLGGWDVAWSASGAAGLLYYVFVGVPLLAAAMAFTRRMETADRARLLSAAAVALPVAVFILRDPIVARLGGAAGPAAVVGAWLWSRVHRSWFARLAAAGVIVTAFLATGFDIDRFRLRRAIAQAATSPPAPALVLDSGEAGLVEYLRRCTQPGDRVLAPWFAPQLYFFSDRGFAGGLVVAFGGHWSEPDRQHRIVAKLKTQSVPLVVFQDDGSEFRATYPIVDEYLRANYRNATTVESYRVLVRNGVDDCRAH